MAGTPKRKPPVGDTGGIRWVLLHRVFYGEAVQSK